MSSLQIWGAPSLYPAALRLLHLPCSWAMLQITTVIIMQQILISMLFLGSRRQLCTRRGFYLKAATGSRSTGCALWDGAGASCLPGGLIPSCPSQQELCLCRFRNGLALGTSTARQHGHGLSGFCPLGLERGVQARLSQPLSILTARLRRPPQNLCVGFCAVCEGAEQRAGQTDIYCHCCEGAELLCVQCLFPVNLSLVTFGKSATRISVQHRALENALFGSGCLGKAEVVPLFENPMNCTVFLPCFPCC